ncbi:hypothetical protein MMC30_004360 [Trapelia coarctata]|nr:hypothetical protein [Trapelia coarctata]
MFGIGISSPRSSLASLETLHSHNSSSGPTPRPSGRVISCTDHLQANDTTPQGPSRSSEDQVTVALQESSRGRSLASSSQTRLSATNDRPEGAASSIGAEPTENNPTLGHTVPVSRDANAYFNPESSRNARPSRLHSRFAARNTAKKLLEHLRRHMPWLKARKIQHASDQQETIPPMIMDGGIMAEPTSTSTPKPVEVSRPVTNAPTEECTPVNNVRIIALPIADTERPASSARPSQEVGPAEANEETWDPVAAKKERIRIRRIQLTLAKERLDHRVCRCSDGCHCMTSGTLETIASTSPRPSDLSSLDLSNVPQHRLSHLLRRSTTSSLFSHSLRNPSPSRHVAFAGAHLETPYPPPQDLTIPSEDGDSQSRRFSRVSASTGITLASQVTTAVNSSSSGSGAPGPHQPSQSRRMNSLPVLTPRQLERICDLLHVDRNSPETQASLRLLTQVSASYAESVASGHGTTRTDSMDVVPQRHSMLLEGMNGHGHGNGRGEIYYGSMMSLSDVPEPSVATVPEAAALTNGSRAEAEGGGSEDVTPRAPESVPMAMDQLSSELEDLARR